MNKINLINHKFIYTIKNDKIISKVYSNTRIISQKYLNPHILGGFGTFYLAVASYFLSIPLRIPIFDKSLSSIFAEEKI